MGATNTKNELFTIPRDCIAGLLEAFSQYPLPPGLTIDGSPTVLDIGANCGGFALYAKSALRAREVICYEPDPDLATFLAANIEGLAGVSSVNAAVGDPDRAFIVRGKNTRLCNSQYAAGERVPCQVVHPQDLPGADMIKIDTEGAEGEILSRLKNWPQLLWVEWHAQGLRRQVDDLATRNGMRLAYCHTITHATGVSCYLTNEQ